MNTQESRTLAEWLREAAYIQRNAAWQGWSGAMKFVAIRSMLREAGISGEAFDNWMARINHQALTATQLNHNIYTRMQRGHGDASR
jgi:hypothetical protein